MLTHKITRSTRAIPLALAVFSALAGAPASAQTHGDVAACSQTGNPSQAVEGCTRLLEGGHLEPAMRAVVHQLRGVAQQAQGRLGPAIRDFAEAKKIDPSDPAAIAGLALVLDDLNTRCFDASAATAALDGCTAIIDHAELAGVAPEVLARAHLTRGLMLVRDGKTVDAARDFQAALASRDRLTREQVAQAEAGLASGKEPVPTATVVVGRAPADDVAPALSGGTVPSKAAEAVAAAEAGSASAATSEPAPELQISSKRPPRPFPLAKRAAPACASVRTASRPAANSARIAWSKGNSHWR